MGLFISNDALLLLYQATQRLSNAIQVSETSRGNEMMPKGVPIYDSTNKHHGQDVQEINFLKNHQF